jgi:hypothetical protein
MQNVTCVFISLDLLFTCDKRVVYITEEKYINRRQRRKDAQQLKSLMDGAIR